MKFPNSLLRGAAVALVVVVLGAVLMWTLNARRPLTLLNSQAPVRPTALQFVPRQAPLTASLLVPPYRLVELGKSLARPGVRGAIDQDLAQLETGLLAGTGLSYARDLQPWLGDEIAFSVVSADWDQDLATGTQPGYLLVLSCRDMAKAEAVLGLFWQNQAVAGRTLGFQRFAGTTIISTEGESSPGAQAPSLPPLATATVGQNFVLVANAPAVLRQALTSALAADVNLAADRTYRHGLAQLPRGQVGLLSLNLPPTLDWLQTGLGNVAFDGIGLGEADGYFDRVLVSFGVDRGGLLGQSLLLAAPGHGFAPPVPGQGSLRPVQLMPPPSAMVAGQSLADLRSALAVWETHYGPATNPLRWLLTHTLARPSQAAWLTAALEEWHSPNFALGMVPVGGAADWQWLLTSDADQGDGAATALDQVGRQQGLSVGPLTIAEKPTMAWTQLTLDPTTRRVQAEVNGIRGRLGDMDVLTTSAALFDTVVTATVDSDWLPQTAPALDLTRGVAYVDWAALRTPLLGGAPRLQLLETAAQPLLRHVRRLVWANQGGDGQLHRGQFWVELTN